MKGPAQYEPNTQEERDEGSEDLFKPEGQRVVVCYFITAQLAAQSKTNRWKLERGEQLCLDKMTELKAICFVNGFMERVGLFCAAETQLLVVLTL